MDQYYFNSDLFVVEPGEDEEINPGVYGRQLAIWLKARLEEAGYSVEPVICEDWGRCLMVSRDPFMLWVGCANVWESYADERSREIPATEKIVWSCFATAEVPFLKKLFGRLNPSPEVARLAESLRSILQSEPRVQLLDER